MKVGAWARASVVFTTVCATLVVALVALELGLRVATPPPVRAEGVENVPLDQNLYVPHPFLGYALRPGFERRSPDGLWFQSTNADGMRGRKLAEPKPPRTYRVLCVGGSTTYGTGARHDDNAYPAVLERLVAERAPEGWSIEVGNCGVPGYSTAETLINVALRLDRFEPDCVLVYHAANDALLIQARDFRADYSHGRRPWAGPAVSPVERAVRRYSRAADLLLRRLAGKPRSLRELVFTEGFEERLLPVAERLNLQGLATFDRNLRSIVALLRARGVDVVLQTFATSADREPAGGIGYGRVVELQNRLIRRTASELGLPVVDVASALDDAPGFFDDWMHLNDAGSRAHAELLVDVVLEAASRASTVVAPPAPSQARPDVAPPSSVRPDARPQPPRDPAHRGASNQP